MVASLIYAIFKSSSSSIKSCSTDQRILSLLLLMWSIGISWTSFEVSLG